MASRTLLRTVLLAGLAGLLAVAGGVLAPVRAQDVFIGKPYSVPDTSELLALVTEARNAAAAGAFEKAALRAQTILDFHGDSVVLVGKVEDERFLGAREWVHGFLAGLPTAGLTAYRTLAGPPARRLLATAAERRDARLLDEVVSRHYLSGEGPAARRALAALALSEGRPAEAATHLTRLLADFPGEARPEDRARLVFSLAKARDGRALAALSAGEPGLALSAEPLIVGGRPTTLGAFVAPLLEEARSLPVRETAEPGDWPLFGRTAARAEPAPSLAGGVGPDAWLVETRFSYKEDDDERDLFAFNRAYRRERLGPEHQPIHPTVRDGVLYFHNGYSLHALNLYTEKHLWSFDGPLRFSPGLTNRGTILSPAVAGDTVFACLEVPSEVPDPSAKQFMRRTVIYYMPQRRLFALEAMTGRLLWSHEDGAVRDPGDAEVLRGLNANSPPLVAGDSVYVLGSRESGRYFCELLAADARTGKIRWHTRLCTGQQELNLFGRPLIELAAGAVSERDGVLYCSTNLGVAAAVDARSGAILWLRGYPQIPIPYAIQWHTTPEREATWANGPPIVTEDTVYLTPTDSRHLVALDRRDGATRFLFYGGDPAVEEEIYRHLLGTAGDFVYVAGPKVLAVHRRTGKVAWGRGQGEFPARPAGGEPEVAIGRGFVATDAVWTATARGIYAFDLASGKRLVDVPRAPDSGDPGLASGAGGNLVLAGQVLLVAHRERITACVLWEKLYAELRRRQEADPRDPRLALEIGQVCTRRDKADEAAAAFRRALALSAGLPEEEQGKVAAAARQGLFDLLASQGARRAAESRSEAALADYGKALEVAPNPPAKVGVLLRMADLFRTAGDKVRLARTYEDLAGDLRDVPHEFPSLGTVPAGLFALMNLAEMAAAEGRAEDAIGYLTRVIAEHPRRPVLGGEDSEKWARGRIDALLAKHGRGAYASFEERAAALLRGAEKARSADGYEAVLRLFPNSGAAGRAAVALGRLLLAEGDYRRAAVVLRRVQAELPDDESAPVLLHLLATALEKRGYLLSARSALIRLSRDHPDATLDVDGRPVRAGEYAAARLREEQFAALTAREKRVDLPLVPLWTADEGETAYVRILDPVGPPPPEMKGVVLLGTNGVLRAVRTASRETVWQIPLNGIVTRPVHSEGVLVLVNNDGLTGLSPATGETLWRSPGRQSVRAVAANPGSVFVLSADPRDPSEVLLRAVSPRSGEVYWERSLPDHQVHDLLLTTEDSVAVSSRDPAGVEVFDTASGRPRFRVEMEERSLYREPFLVDESSLFLSHANQRLELYDLSSGRRVFSTELPNDRPYRTAVPAPGGVFLIDSTESLLFIDAADGKVRWSAPAVPKAPPQYQGEAADEQRVYVVRRRDEGQVYYAEARDNRTGEILWRVDLLTSKSATPAPLLTERYAIFHMNSFDFGQGAWTSETIFVDKSTGAAVQRLAPPELAGVFTYPVVGDAVFGIYAAGKVAFFGPK